MDPITVSYILNAVLGIAAYLMKQAHNDLKVDNARLWKEVTHIKDTYFKKEDFSEFKQELWKRFDRLEDDMRARVEELKK